MSGLTVRTKLHSIDLPISSINRGPRSPPTLTKTHISTERRAAILFTLQPNRLIELAISSAVSWLPLSFSFARTLFSKQNFQLAEEERGKGVRKKKKNQASKHSSEGLEEEECVWSSRDGWFRFLREALALPIHRSHSMSATCSSVFPATRSSSSSRGPGGSVVCNSG